jgi:hypothetical protein
MMCAILTKTFMQSLTSFVITLLHNRYDKIFKQFDVRTNSVFTQLIPQIKTKPCLLLFAYLFL